MQISSRGPMFDAASVLLELADQSSERRADLPAHRMVGPAVDPRDPVVGQGSLGRCTPLDARNVAVAFVRASDDLPQDLDVFDGSCQGPCLRHVHDESIGVPG